MMLLTALGCALQMAVATVPPPLPVLVGDRRRTVPVVKATDGSLAMRADLLGDALGGEFLADGGTRYHLLLAGTRIDVEVGSAFARLAPDTFSLASTVYREGGRVYVPFAFATELVPRVVTGVLFDTERRELRRFGDVSARRAAPAPAPASPVYPSSTPPPSRSASSATPAAASTRAPTGARQRVVVVDAGHGGVDKGMTGPLGATNKVNEKDITLAVARELKSELERRGILRGDDAHIGHTDRARRSGTHRQSRQGRPVHVRARQRGQSALEPAGVGAGI